MPIPVITLCLTAAALGLVFLPETLQSTLYLNVESSPWWNLISGHWVHADLSHLSWNLAALLILGGIMERHSKRLLLASLAAGMIGVNILLLSPLAGIQYYCGLSGVLNALLGVVLCLLWKSSRNPVLLAIAGLSIAKIAIEVASGGALLTDISVPPYPLSHLAGLLATPLAFGINACGKVRQFKTLKSAAC